MAKKGSFEAAKEQHAYKLRPLINYLRISPGLRKNDITQSDLIYCNIVVLKKKVHIFLYIYINGSVLLENTPLVNSRKATTGIRVAHFPYPQ